MYHDISGLLIPGGHITIHSSSKLELQFTGYPSVKFTESEWIKVHMKHRFHLEETPYNRPIESLSTLNVEIIPSLPVR